MRPVLIMYENFPALVAEIGEDGKAHLVVFTSHGQNLVHNVDISECEVIAPGSEGAFTPAKKNKKTKTAEPSA
jgi:hypothetical protein